MESVIRQRNFGSNGRKIPLHTCYKFVLLLYDEHVLFLYKFAFFFCQKKHTCYFVASMLAWLFILHQEKEFDVGGEVLRSFLLARLLAF